MLLILDKNKIAFPDPQTTDYDENLVVGGDLSVERLILAYENGIFPWFPYRQRHITWCCPKQRYVIFPNQIHISHSMRNIINKQIYSFTIDKCFSQVIEKCSIVNGRIDDPAAWLGHNMINAYTNLHKKGYATSVEVWCDGQLVGGLYGVQIKHCFMGESMFSLKPNASKFALIMLAKQMQKLQMPMIDCQMETPHLKSMGGTYISYDLYLKILNNQIDFENYIN